MNIGKKIYLLRKDLGLTQFELSEMAGVNQNTLYNYENNKTEPRYSYVEWLLGAMGYELVIQKKRKESE